MTGHTPSLAVVFHGWDRFQRDLLKAVTPLSPEQWALPVAPTHWPINRLVQHIIGDRVWWFHLWMGEGGANVTPFIRWDEEGRPMRSPAQLIAGLEATWGVIADALARGTVADLGHVFGPPATLTEAERTIFGPSTRQEIIFQVLRHDLHHGGSWPSAWAGITCPPSGGSGGVHA